MSDATTESLSVLKSSVYLEPIKFKTLTIGENINDVPENILSSLSESVANADCSGSKGFNSFRLALQFPECLNDVDIVTNADNIKNMLKLSELPNNGLSMLVHKVGNSLLLDELATDKIPSKEVFLNLKNYTNNLISSEFKNLTENTNFGDNDSELLSKFLSNSIQSVNIKESVFNKVKYDATEPLKPCGYDLPEPSFEAAIPLSKHGHSFKRNVVWNFAGFQMLIGTNMEIFQNSDHQSVSLRLNDISSPLMPANGKDFWLDSLMLNIPEVLICHHLEGVVKKYQLIKTVDLPFQYNCEFSPKIVQNTAINIIGSLKHFVTKRGHTYLLHKEKGKSDLMLYDLTILFDLDEHLYVFPETPFTVAIGMLHYTLASKIMSTPDQLSEEKKAFILELLLCSKKLIPIKIYPEIMQSVSFCVSLIYIPTNIDLSTMFSCGTDINKNDIPTDCKKPAIQIPKEGVIITQILKNPNLNRFEKVRNEQPCLYTSTYNRCKRAMLQIVAGIQCANDFFSHENNGVKKNEKFSKQKCFTVSSVPCADLNTDIFCTWRLHIKLHLMNQASVVYKIQSRCNFVDKYFGSALKFAHIGLLCQNYISSFYDVDIKDRYLIYCVGEYLQSIVCHYDYFDTYYQEYKSSSYIDAIILQEIAKSENKNEDFIRYTEILVKDFEKLCNKCVQMYEEALKYTSPDKLETSLAHLGFNIGILGNRIFKYANDYYDNNMDSKLDASEKNKIDMKFVALIGHSWSCVNNAYLKFCQLGQKRYMALLLLNQGYIFNHCIKNYSRVDLIKNPQIITPIFKRALFCFEQSKKLLDQTIDPMLWDLIRWEECGSYISIAEFSQINGPFSENQNRDTIDQLNSALNICNKSKCFYLGYKYRKGYIHARIAAYQFARMTVIIKEGKSFKNHYILSNVHYKQSVQIFRELLKLDEYFIVQLERIECQHYLVSSLNSSKMKNLVIALNICLESIDIFEYIGSSSNNFDYSSNLLDQILKFQTELQNILKQLIRFTTLKKGSIHVSVYKEMYLSTLHHIKFTDEVDLAKHLHKVLTDLIRREQKKSM